MAAPMNTGLPDGLALDQDYTIRFAALDASTGAEVSTVVITAANFTAHPLGETTLGDLVQPVESAVLLPIAEGQDALPESIAPGDNLFGGV